MKRKIFTVLFALIALACLCFGLAACGENHSGADGGTQSGGGQGDTGADGGTQSGGEQETDIAERMEIAGIYDEAGENLIGCTLISLRSASDIEHLEIPATYHGLPLLRIERGFAMPTYHGMQSQNTILKSVRIPETVTEIEELAFAGCESLQSVTVAEGNPKYHGEANNVIETATKTLIWGSPDGVIPQGTLAIGNYAFGWRTSLSGKLNIPDSVTTIGISAFYNCSGLTSISIPNSVTSIGEWAFYGCSGLESVTFGSNCKFETIGNNVFAGCTSLLSISIPNNVTEIGARAFDRCSDLESVTFGSDCKLETIESRAFSECTSLTEFAIPKGVTSIESYAFDRCTSLTAVVIPDSVTEVAWEAFYECPIEQATMPTCAIQAVGSYYGNAHLKTVVLTSGEEIPSSAFSACISLEEVTIPSSVTSIGSGAFYGCISLTHITIPASVTEIGTYAFENCYKLIEVWNYSNVYADTTDPHVLDVFPRYLMHLYTSNEKSKQTVTDNGYIFYEEGDLSLLLGYRGEGTELHLPAKSPSGKDYAIYHYAFYGQSQLKSIAIPDNILVILDEAFSDTAYYNDASNWDDAGVLYIDNHLIKADPETLSGAYTVKAGVKTIAANAFGGCTELTGIAIPSSLITIGESAFGRCEGLNAVLISDLAAWCDINFSDAGANPLALAHHLYYNGAEIEVLSIPSGVQNIKSHAFVNCDSIKVVSIPNGVTNIGANAFANCTSLASVKIPDSATKIEETAFSNCPIEQVTMPTYAISAISGIKFQRNTNLKAVVLTSGETIGENAFDGCTSLSSISIPDSVTAIGAEAFCGCSGLTSIQLPDRVTTIGAEAFYGCSGLIDIVIPDSVTSIGKWAFYGCNALKSITIGSDVNYIGLGAFNGCDTLQAVYISDLSAWCNIEFANTNANPLAIAQHLYSGDTEVTDLTIPGDVTTIKQYAFYCCTGLISVTIPDSVSTIEAEAFSNCVGLTRITIGSNVNNIERYAFYGCYKLFEVWNHSGLTIEKMTNNNGSVGLYAKYVYTTDEESKQTTTSDGFIFYEDGEESCLLGYTGTLTKIVLSDHSPSGKDYTVFRGNDLHTEVTDTPLFNAFGELARLESISVGEANSNYSSQEGILYNKAKTEIVFVPRAIKGEVHIPEGVTLLKYADFISRNELKAIALPDSISWIDSEVFGYCAKLESITVGEGHPNYSSQDGILYNKAKTMIAFVPLAVTGTIRLPDSITSVEGLTFENRTALFGVEIPDSVTRIGYRAFWGCSELKQVTIGSGVIAIEEGAFTTCNKLTSITWNAENYTVGYNPFMDPVFAGCYDLKTVTFGENVKTIPGNLFRYCTELTDIQFKGTVKEWQDIEKSYGWDLNIGSDYTITCTDGTITKDGTVTYFGS